MPPFNTDLLKYMPDTHQPQTLHQRELAARQRAARRLGFVRLLGVAKLGAISIVKDMLPLRTAAERNI